MAYHVNEKQEIKPCEANPYNPNSTGCKFGVPLDQHFATQADAIEFTEKQESQANGLFPVNMSTKPEAKNYRRVRSPEPPVITDDRYWDEDPKNDEVRERSYVENTEDPNSRQLNDPDARYIGAQVRSRRQSYSPDDSHSSLAPKTKEVYAGGKKHKFSFDQDGYLHNFNKPSYEDPEISVFYNNGVIHRDPDDGPALSFTNNRGHIYIYHGLYHNPNGPAVVMEDRTEYWLNGLQHRIGAPAVIHANGTLEYWERGEHKRTIEPEVPVSPDALRGKRRRVYSDEQAMKWAAEEANALPQNS